MIKDINIPSVKVSVAEAVGAGANSAASLQSGSLAGKLLVASPALQDGCFAKAVIYLCVHDSFGAMGVVVNYPVKNVEVEDIMEQLNMEGGSKRDLPVHFGGPVESNRGFIVHSDEFVAAGTIYQNDGMAVTSNAEVLRVIASGEGPKQGLLALGYAGWSAGQLESEIESGNWIVAPASKQILFDTDNDMKWSLAIASLGFDVGNFSSVVGHA